MARMTRRNMMAHTLTDRAVRLVNNATCPWIAKGAEGRVKIFRHDKLLTCSFGIDPCYVVVLSPVDVEELPMAEDHHANYVVLPESRVDQLVIRDLGPWDQYRTVTNDAEHVVKELTQQGYLYPGRRLIYIDSEGERD